jgi:EAL domain-containing protein (putative c-di-GMP-specific phosphodiesterase class I)/CheY-like chemotaxis protein
VLDDDALAVGDRVLAELRRPFTLDGRVLNASASIGVAVATPGIQASELLRNADVAMYAAKQAGKSRVQLFLPAMHAALVERLTLEAALRQAVDEGAFMLHYQPIVDATTGAIDTLEALVRWPREDGLVPPDQFIPVAEETGLIIGLGEWVLTEALRELAKVSDLHPNLKMSVNVSARQLDQYDLPDMVARLLAETGVAPHRLTLEVTENVVMERAQAALKSLDRLRSIGVCVSIDDFGTGYSSLSRLRQLPVSELKIDKSFIDDVDTDGTRTPVVAAVVALAKNLALDTVAEGVETPEQLAILRSMGCAHLQGFLFSEPLPAGEIEALLSFPNPFASLLPPSPSGYEPTARQAEVMNVVSTTLTGRGTLEAVSRPLLTEVCRMTGLESAYLTRIDKEAGTQEVVYVNNVGDLQIPEGVVIDWNDTICKYALDRGPAVSMDAVADFPECDAAALLGLRTFVTVPVVTSNGTMFGTLCAGSQQSVPVSAATPRLMDLFASLMADAFERQAVDSAPPVPNDGPPPMRVAIAEDSDVVRHLLRQALKADGRFDVVAESVRGDEVLPLCRAFHPDVLLLDLDLPTIDGLTVLPDVRAESPETAVVVITGHGGDRVTAQAKSAGALAVIDKRGAVDVVAAIAEALGV